MKGELLLLPNLLNPDAHADVFLPQSVAKAVSTLNGLICESEKEGRVYLKRFDRLREIPLALFNKHHRDIDALMAPMKKGEKWGLISDAGLPIIADPGYELVARARNEGIKVKTFVGPCSIILALQLSGLPSQRFSFHGYLPKGKPLFSFEQGVTHIFIEAPFRSHHHLQNLIDGLPDEAHLSVAWDLTMPTQGVETHPVGVWRKRQVPSLEKKPAIFLFHMSSAATSS